MRELDLVLDELVADAPVDRIGWEDVLARSRRGRITSSSRPRKRLAIALATIVVLGVAGTAVAVGVSLLDQQKRFHDSAPDDPERLGPLVEVTAGESWALIAWQSKYGICVDFAIPGNSPFSCGFPVRGAKPSSDTSGAGAPTHAVAGFVSGGGLVGGDGQTTIFGVAANEVARVTVELHDGRVIDAQLHDAPPALDAEVRFFIVRLPLRSPEPVKGLQTELYPNVVDPVRAYSAYASDGSLIERVED